MKTLAAVFAGLLITTGCALESMDESQAGDDAGDDTAGEEVSDLEEAIARHCDHNNRLANNVPVRDESGLFTSVSTQGYIDLDNEFFQDLGKNGRRCVSCHVPTVGWTITPKQLQAAFYATDGGKYDDGLGLGAVFRTNDGSNSPNADVSSLAKRKKAYSMLLTKGLVRVGLPMPANAEFDLIAVDDPYKFASAAELSLFRRPLPTANLKFDSTVMWDGREVVPGASVDSELLTQSNNAVLGHAQGKALSNAARRSIVDFEVSVASAQIYDRQARDLRDDGAKGGPAEIHKQEFYIGINDNFGDSKTGKPFDANVFTIFNKWTRAYGSAAEARRSVARGQALFNNRAINISGVSGINDEAAFGKPAVLKGTCTTCHDTPNGGNHSVVAPLNIGLVDASRRTADMPLYTFRNKTTGETVKVTDPGRALISGKWSHIGRFKGPMLRNLAPRAPYFHNGFAKDLDAVVDFYEDRFDIGLSKQDKKDLIAFLRSL